MAWQAVQGNVLDLWEKASGLLALLVKEGDICIYIGGIPEVPKCFYNMKHEVMCFQAVNFILLH